MALDRGININIEFVIISITLEVSLFLQDSWDSKKKLLKALTLLIEEGSNFVPLLLDIIQESYLCI